MQGCCSMFAPQSRYRDSSRYISVPREDDGNSRTRNPPVLFSPPKILSPSSCKRNLGIHRFWKKTAGKQCLNPDESEKPGEQTKRKDLIHIALVGIPIPKQVFKFHKWWFFLIPRFFQKNLCETVELGILFPPGWV